MLNNIQKRRLRTMNYLVGAKVSVFVGCFLFLLLSHVYSCTSIMIVQIGMLFAGMLFGYFFCPKFIDDFHLFEDGVESLGTNAMMIQPSKELGALVDSISNANFMKPPVESEVALKVKEPFPVDLCSQSSCLLSSTDKNKLSKVETMDQKNTSQKDMNLDDLVAKTPEVGSPAAFDLQRQSKTTITEIPTSTPPEKTLSKDNVEGKSKAKDKKQDTLVVNEKKPSKKKAKKGSEKQVKEKDKKDKLGLGSGSGSKKNGADGKDDVASVTTTSQPNQQSGKSKDEKTKVTGEKKAKKKKTKLSKGKKKKRTKEEKRSKNKEKKKAKKNKKNKIENES